MHLGRPLPKAFFDRPCAVVARDLVGCVLVRKTPGGQRLAGRLVEVEAYLGDGSDPGSHCHRGRTPRNATMFGPPGRVYTYLSYGVHTCANLVCEPKGRGAGILLRAAEPLLGVEDMRRRRGLADESIDRRLAGGPGRLAQAFGLTLDHDGVSALSGEWTIRARTGSKPPRIGTSRRIGLTKGAELPLRFAVADSPWLSRKG
jgi:DNA-3-methyladenine glycosylase